jgi:hypothetical protein
MYSFNSPLSFYDLAELTLSDSLNLSLDGLAVSSVDSKKKDLIKQIKSKF